MKRVHSAALLAIALGACAATTPGPMAVMSNVSPNWRKMATEADRERLRNWRATWIDALARARKSGAGAAIAAEGALFDPDRALAGAVPPPGSYRCRVFKLGANGTAMTDFTAYPATECQISAEGEFAGFATMAGGQRPVGILFKDSDTRAIFLGTLAVGDETQVMHYGRDASRDVIGFTERVGDKRWRLVEPAPAFESLINIVELVPAR